MIRSVSFVVQRELRQASFGKPGCIGLSGTLSVKVRPLLMSARLVLPFSTGLVDEIMDIVAYSAVEGLRGLVAFSLVSPLSTLPTSVALQVLKLETASLI